MQSPQRLDVIDRIVATDLCTGCGACAALAPKKVSIGVNGEGYLRPKVKGSMSRKTARQVMAVCPGAGQAGGVAEGDPLWGDFVSVREGWANDKVLRHAAASGGGLSAICVWLLDSGRVDGVLQVAADPKNPMGNRTVISRNEDDVLAASASRYAPSAPLLSVPELLVAGGRYVFVGKPCDVAALRSWGRFDARVDTIFPVKLSFFCAGVPSLDGAAQVAGALGVDTDDVAAFRYRGNGWPGLTEVTDLGGARRSMTYHESWGGVLSKHVQPRCRICADGTGMAADIAFADAWQTDAEGYPLFEEEDGRSLIVGRTSLGETLLQDAMTDGALTAIVLSPDKIAAMQPGQLRRRRELLGRLAGRVMAGLPVPRYRRMGVWACGRRTPLRQTMRAAFGMARRCMRRRRFSG